MDKKTGDSCLLDAYALLEENRKQFPKYPIRYLINRIQLYGNACVVEAWQRGNTVWVKVQRLGLFKRYKGIPFVAELKIDPTQVVQPPQ